MSYNTLPYEQLVEIAEAAYLGNPIISPDRGLDEITLWYKGTVVAKQRARSGASGKHYTPKKTRDFEKAVSDHCLKLMKDKYPVPLAMPVKVALVVATKIPSSWPEWKQNLALLDYIVPDKQDTDNKVKAIFDALNGVLWTDDKLAYAFDIRDIYREDEGFHITASPVGLTRQEIQRIERIIKGMG